MICQLLLVEPWQLAKHLVGDCNTGPKYHVSALLKPGITNNGSEWPLKVTGLPFYKLSISLCLKFNKLFVEKLFTVCNTGTEVYLKFGYVF